jgi:hypothetical protein
MTKQAAQAGSAEDAVFNLFLPLKGQGHIVTFDRFFSIIPLIDRLHGIGVKAVGMINKNQADQPILFESDLKKDDVVGKMEGKGPRKSVFM